LKTSRGELLAGTRHFQVLHSRISPRILSDMTDPNSVRRRFQNSHEWQVPISTWALAGAGCGLVVAVATVALGFSGHHVDDKGTEAGMFIAFLLFSVTLFSFVGVVAGAVIGFRARRRNEQEARGRPAQSPRSSE
jgi:hypothetical protein